MAKIMQQADVLLFPSLFESFGLVAYEAIACGTPVILSNLEVFEKKLAGKNFVSFFEKNSAEDLATAITNRCNKGLDYQQDEMHRFVSSSFSILSAASLIFFAASSPTFSTSAANSVSFIFENFRAFNEFC